MTPIRLNVRDIQQAFFPLLISPGRQADSKSNSITEDNDLITVHTSFSLSGA